MKNKYIVPIEKSEFVRNFSDFDKKSSPHSN